MPAALCGSIIGKGGATIRSFSEDSKAQIGLSPQVLELCDVHLRKIWWLASAAFLCWQWSPGLSALVVFR